MIIVQLWRALHVDFTTGIVPIFSKVGYSNGNCRGATKGRKGFNLLLIGYDLDADYRVVEAPNGWPVRLTNNGCPVSSALV